MRRKAKKWWKQLSHESMVQYFFDIYPTIEYSQPTTDQIEYIFINWTSDKALQTLEKYGKPKIN